MFARSCRPKHPMMLLISDEYDIPGILSLLVRDNWSRISIRPSNAVRSVVLLWYALICTEHDCDRQTENAVNGLQSNINQTSKPARLIDDNNPSPCFDEQQFRSAENKAVARIFVRGKGLTFAFFFSFPFLSFPFPLFLSPFCFPFFFFFSFLPLEVGSLRSS